MIEHLIDLLQAMRKEYRGQRSVDAFTNFIRKEMKSAIKEFHSPEDFKPNVSIVHLCYKAETT